LGQKKAQFTYIDSRPEGTYDARAMGDPLRDRRPPRDLAESRQLVEISSEIGEFSRLVEVVNADLSALDSGNIPANWRKSTVSGRLKFGFSEVGDDVAGLDLRLEATVPAICQRCLRPFEWPLKTSLALLLCTPGDELVEQQGFEIWELDDESTSPIDIADEALVMAMPLSAMHENVEDCVEVTATQIAKETTTPFAKLREQMDKGT
jgi:uncharacterized protein